VSPAGEPDPPKGKRTGRPDGADRREPEKEKDPGSAFGPESVPLATSSVSVVYWVPGPWTNQQHTSDRGDVNHEPWPPARLGERVRLH
jgi:hypothetical protein